MKEPQGPSFYEGNRQIRNEVICGVDRGYIRSDPEKMKGLFSKSLSDGNVFPEPDEATTTIAQRVIDIASQFGRTIIKSGQRRHGIIEGYNSSTTIKLDNQRLKIIIEGPIDISQLPTTKESFASPVGNILPEPKVDIDFETHHDDDTQEGVRFVFGRDGTTRFEQWKDDQEGYRVTDMTADEAKAYLLEHLPMTTDNGQPELSKGKSSLPKDTIRIYCNDIRLARLDTNEALQRNLEEKRKRYGADQVLYLPQKYFSSHSKDGELFAVEYPQNFIPEDILEFPTVSKRIDKIISEMEIDIDDQRKKDMVTLLEGLPGGICQVAVLMQKDEKPFLPETIKVATTITDKAITYLLQHPEKIDDPVKKYRSLWKQIGKEPYTPWQIEIGLSAGLFDELTPTSQAVFSDPATINFGEAEIPDTVRNAISESYLSFLNLGKILKSEVYSPQELDIILQGQL